MLLYKILLLMTFGTTLVLGDKATQTRNVARIWEKPKQVLLYVGELIQR